MDSNLGNTKFKFSWNFTFAICLLKLIPLLVNDCKRLLPSGFILQHDGAPAHTARLTQDWLKTNCNDFIALDEWPNNWPAELHQNAEEIYYNFFKVHLSVLTIYIFILIINERLILVNFFSLVMQDTV